MYKLYKLPKTTFVNYENNFVALEMTDVAQALPVGKKEEFEDEGLEEGDEGIDGEEGLDTEDGLDAEGSEEEDGLEGEVIEGEEGSESDYVTEDDQVSTNHFPRWISPISPALPSYSTTKLPHSLPIQFSF